MNKIDNIKWMTLSCLFLLLGAQTVRSQAIGASGALKWLRVNELHTYFSEQGSEGETGGTELRNNTFSWPGQYGIIQSTMRAKGMWLGAMDYYNSKVNRSFEYIVTNIGLKVNEYDERPVFDAVDFRLVGKFDHPVVSVDGELASNTTFYDVLDEVDPDLVADRMLVVKNHTSIGATVTKKIYAFTQQEHDNYYIYDYIIKNTGIIDNEGTVNEQTLNGFYFYLLYRYALSGESVWDDANNAMQGWGTNNSSWGRNVVNHVIGTDPADPEFNDPNSPLYKLRAHYAWYSPLSTRPLPLEDDWGCPNEKDDGILAAAKFVGHSVLYADQAPGNSVDNPSQPVTTHFIDVDSDPAQRAGSQYNEPLMADRYEYMSWGHAEKTQAELVEESGLAADAWGPGIGGTGSVQGFGPYTLKHGDSIHIVVAGGVAGISREKNREVGANWLEYFNGTGAPALIMPDKSQTNNHTEYKKAWVLTCKDSILKTFQNARISFESGYNIPQPPPPPETFTVISGGDRIRLTWADNAATAPGFDGYIIYRSEGNVSEPRTVYKKVFECDGPNVVHEWDDITAARGFDYYYYIQSKDDGSINNGVPLKSSMFYTLTSVPAYLRRPQGSLLEEVRVVPNPYDIRARSLQFGDKYQYDRIAFYELPGICKVKVFTERGDLIWEKDHTDGSGDELWDSMTSSGQIIVSGIYILYVEVTQNIRAEEDIVARRDYYHPEYTTRDFGITRTDTTFTAAGLPEYKDHYGYRYTSGGEPVYKKGDVLYKAGDLMYRKGESVTRKFVVIR